MTMKIDLRSDTVTKPSAEMKAFMFDAELGDDVFEEDPSIIELENYGAKMFGHEAAIFCPSGTMTNQIAIKLHTVPGSEVICHQESHVYNYEGGGIAVNSQSSVKLLTGNNGRINPDDIAASVHPDDIHKPVTSLICVEDTSNRGGGCCYDVADLEKISAEAKKYKLPLHCDGARLFNALVKRGDDYRAYGAMFDTISICLSKGLGAPVGSLLIGSKSDIKRARRIRKVFGGGMRQAGLIAAGGLYALKNNIERLTEDHRRAELIGNELKSMSFVDHILPIETNILVFALKADIQPSEFITRLLEKDILAVPFGGQYIRFVTHLDFDDAQMEALINRLKEL